jgi:cardiolipin synthase
MLRFALVPVATILIYFGYTIGALIVYITACSTDLLDGYIARRANMVTEEGMLLDPLADKLMALFVIVSFTVTRVLPPFVLIILLAKELLMIGGGIFLYFKNIVAPANIFGKIAAFLLNTAIALTFLHELIAPWHVYVISFALGIMVLSLLQYAYFNMYKKLKES